MGAWNHHMLVATFRRDGIAVASSQPFGPDGLHLTVRAKDGVPGSVIVTQADFDGEEWIHASIALAFRDPTYAELVSLHRAVFGRKRPAYQVFVPANEHVNIHKHALHLWGRADGERALPDFGRFGTI